MCKKFLTVVDMQNVIIDGALGTAEAVAIVDNVTAKIRAARAEGTEVWFTRDTHEENYLETQEGRNLPVKHCIRGTFGWEISSKLDVDGELAQLILSMYEKILAGATVADLRRAADAAKAATLKPIV